MSLAAYHGGLARTGLRLDDVQWKSAQATAPAQAMDWAACGRGSMLLQPCALNVKCTSAVDAANRAGVVVDIDLDAQTAHQARVNSRTISAR